MPKPTKETQAKTTPVVVEEKVAPAVTSTPTTTTTTEPAVAEKKPRAPRAKKQGDVVATTVASTSVEAPKKAEEKVASTDEAQLVEETSEDATKASRVPPTRESVLAEHSEILNLLEQEVARIRDGSDKTVGVKFLRSVIRRVKSAQNNSARVMKQKLPSARKNNNSGFLKPVKISQEMAKFTGLDPNGLHSRVDVTKYLCKYISERNLQDPNYRRHINPDNALSKLLGYDAKKADKPLTYPHIQSLLKSHITSPGKDSSPKEVAVKA